MTSPARSIPTPAGPRPGARVLLLDAADRVLLLHAADPSAPTRHWWELPGGGLEPGESSAAACRRELAEETGILLDHVGPCIWVRESRFTYKGRRHHRKDWIHLARVPIGWPRVPTRHTSNERAGLLGERWWTLQELSAASGQRIIPPGLPTLLPAILAGQCPPTPLDLAE